MSKYLRNRRGLTLVEALLGVLVLGIAAYTMADVTNLLSRSTSYGERSQALIALQDRIRQRLTYQQTCEAAIATAGGQNQGTIDMGALMAGNQQITISMPGIQSGMDLSGSTISQGQVILLSQLQINGLRLTNVRNYDSNYYVAQVEISASSTSGFPFAAVSATTVEFTVVGSSITGCSTLSSNVTEQICETMGCTWSTSASPSCQCATIGALCPLGQLPTGFSGGKPVCQALGNTCPTGQFVTGLSLMSVTCAPLPP